MNRAISFAPILVSIASALYADKVYEVFLSKFTECGRNGEFCWGSSSTSTSTTSGDDRIQMSDDGGGYELCERVRESVSKEVFGQFEALEVSLDAMCDKFVLMKQERRSSRRTAFDDYGNDGDFEVEENVSNGEQKPLVISVHGSPGVGKSLFHRALARSLYGVGAKKVRLKDEVGDQTKFLRTAIGKTSEFVFSMMNNIRKEHSSEQKSCPGELCPAYKILFGADYVERERAEQKRMIVRSLRRHLRRFPESVVVIEEYDKLPCEVRSVLRQLFDSGRVRDVESLGSSSSSSSNNMKKERKKMKNNLYSINGLKEMLLLKSRFWRKVDDDVAVVVENELEYNVNDDDDDDEGEFGDYNANGEKREVLGNRAIFILEANAGFVQIHAAAEADRRRSKEALGNANKSERERSNVELSRALKNAMFTKWENEHCEDFHDTVKVLSSIEYFVPFQPLDEDALKQIANAQLEFRAKNLIMKEFLERMFSDLSTRASKKEGESVLSSIMSDEKEKIKLIHLMKKRIHVALKWDDSVLTYVARESEFEGDFAIEGGKEVKATLSRTVTRAIRKALTATTAFTDNNKSDDDVSALYKQIITKLLDSSVEGERKNSTSIVDVVVRLRVHDAYEEQQQQQNLASKKKKKRKNINKNNNNGDDLNMMRSSSSSAIIASIEI